MKAYVTGLARRQLWIAAIVARLQSLVLGVVAYPLRFFGFPFVHFGSRVKLIGVQSIKIGRNTTIASGTWLNVNEQSSERPSLQIGENCFIGQDNFMSVGKEITFGDYCLTTKGCAFVCSTHIYSDPEFPYIKSSTTADQRIAVGSNCFFGLGAKVFGNVQIGHGSVVGAGCEVRNDIPPFSLVVGSPAKIVRRYDFEKQSWVPWPSASYVEGPDPDEYLKTLRDRAGWIILPLSASSGPFHDTP